MNKTIKIIIAAVIAAAAVAVFLYAQSLEDKQSDPEAGLAASGIVINEFMAANRSTIADDNGDFSDWIEIHNTSGKAIDLTGYMLSDDPDQAKWRFPPVILQPDGYMLIFASGNTVVDVDAPYLHTEFRLSAKGGGVYLSNSAGKMIGAVEYTEQQGGISMGRDAANSGEWIYFDAPTPGFANDQAGADAFAATRVVENVDLFITEVMASNNTTVADANGNFNDYIEIYNAGDEEVGLADFSLSDNPDNATKWRFPDVSIAPGEYMIVFASGEDADSTDIASKQIHTSFRISAYRETILIADAMGMTLDEVLVSEVADDSAFMRELGPDGVYTDTWAESDKPSPGFPNDENGHTLFEQQNVVAAGAVVISEVMIANNTFLPEDNGECYDWIEIVNRGSEPVDLSGYSLTDDTGMPTKWRFEEQTVIAPGQYMTVLASGLADVPDEEVKKNYIHTNFRLSAAGEVLALYDGDAKLQDRFRIHELPYGVSIGRNGEENALFYFTQPTPNAANASANAGIVDTPQPSAQGGSYGEAQQIAFACETTNVKIYYTTDGTEPTQQSSEYTSPIDISQTGMIRARAYKEGYIASAIGTQTYFIGEMHELPLLSIVTEPDNLWDEQTGIYAMGPNAEDVYPFIGANFHENWEKPASFEVFDEEGNQTFSQNVALRIQGGYSRGKNQKSFAIFARSEYGPGVMAYSFFDNRPFTEYQALQLRQGGQDQDAAKIKEATLLALVEDQGFNFLTQAVKPYVLYLNGEYWGVYYMQEKRNEDFIAAHEGVDDPDNMNILKATSLVIQGSRDEYKALLTYIESNDLSKQEHFDYIAQYIDTDSFMDVMVNQVWIANSDYGNMQFYQILPEGKWKQIYYDFCWTFNKSAFPEANHPTLSIRMEDKTTASTLFNGLLSYKPWRDAFIERFAWALDEIYDPDRVLAEIDNQAALVRAEIPAEREKHGGTFGNWEANVESMRAFAEKRGADVVKQLKETFSLSSEQIHMLEGAIAAD